MITKFCEFRTNEILIRFLFTVKKTKKSLTWSNNLEDVKELSFKQSPIVPKMRRSFSHSEIVCVDSELATPLIEAEAESYLANDWTSKSDAGTENRVIEMNIFLKDFAYEFKRKYMAMENDNLSSAHIETMRNVAEECFLSQYESFINLLNSKLNK
jgi:hypothetical protein